MQKYTELVLGQRGNFMLPVPNASVSVLTSPGSVMATIYSDNGVTVTNNPLTTDSEGRYSFYAANGRYTVVVTASGTTKTLTDIVLEDDPINANAAVVVGGSIDATPVGATIPSTGSFSSLALASVSNHGVVLATSPFTTAAPVTSGYALIDNGAGNSPSMQGFSQPGANAIQRAWNAKIGEYVASSADYAGATDDIKIANAFNDLLSRPAGGTLLIKGNATLAGPVVLDCAQNPNGPPTTAQQQWRLKIVCNGSITPTAGIGTAITVKNAINPEIELNFVGGGTTTDVGFVMNNTRGGRLNITGWYYGGILWNYIAANGTVVELMGAWIYANHCYQAVKLQGGSSGFGVIDTIWDIYSTVGMLVQSISDVTIKHVETTAPTGRADNNLNIQSCGNMHLGTVALGMAGSQLMVVQNSIFCTIKDLYLYGAGLNLVDGLLVIDSDIDISRCVAFGVNNGVLVDGGTDISIGEFSSKNNTTDFLIRKLASSNTFANVRISRYFGNTPVAGFVNSNSSITTGSFYIGSGITNGGNTGNTASTYGMNINCSSAFIAKIDNFTIGPGTNPFTKSFRTVNQPSANCYRCSFAEGAQAGSADISADGTGQMVPAAATPLVFGTTYQNTSGWRVLYTVPVIFNNPVGNSNAAVQLQDTLGNVFDLIDRHDYGPSPGNPIEVLQFVVPNGWSFQIKRSATADVSLTGTTRVMTI